MCECVGVCGCVCAVCGVCVSDAACTCAPTLDDNDGRLPARKPSDQKPQDPREV